MLLTRCELSVIIGGNEIKRRSLPPILGYFLRPVVWGIRTQNTLNMGQGLRLSSLRSPFNLKNKGITKITELKMRVLTFNGRHLSAIQRNNNLYLTSKELAKGLGYEDDHSINRIYARHSDEFTPEMTCGVKLTPRQTTRAFSPRGCHLIAMFAKTPFAKDFRKWILDVLEKEQTEAHDPRFNPQPQIEQPKVEPPHSRIDNPQLPECHFDSMTKSEADNLLKAIQAYGRSCYNIGTLDAVYNLQKSGMIKGV